MDNLTRQLKFTHGLIPAVIAEADGTVLVLSYMDEEALRHTVETGFVHVFRRTHGQVMMKGETSGHTQRVREVRVNCDGNSLLITVDQKVACCHMGYRSCFYRRYLPEEDRWEECEERVFDPEEVYGRSRPAP